MGYELYWSRDQVERAAQDYTPQAAERLCNVLEEKERQLMSVDNPAALPRRFHNTFTLDGLKVAAIRFNVQGKAFRAICIVIHDEQAVAFHTCVDKAGQEQLLGIMRREADRIETTIREEFAQGDP